MKRFRIHIFAAFIAAVCTFVLASCGSSKPAVDCSVSWNIPEKVTVSAEGFDSLPTTVKEGTVILVNVQTEAGYKVESVKATNDKYTVTNQFNADSSGKYPVTIKGNGEVTVAVEELVSSVAITSQPVNLTYYAGDHVDTTGMEVTVTYETGRTETRDDYEVYYPNGWSFKIGDTSFTVAYGGKESQAVTISSVVGKITLLTDGGTIDNSVISGWRNAGLDVRETDTGFDLLFTELTNNVVLPTAGQISKGAAKDDFVFTGWTVNTVVTDSIDAGKTTSLTAQTKFYPKLVDFTSVGYEYRTVGEQADVLCVVVRGTFRSANSVNVRLYGANVNALFSDYVINGTRGGNFEYVFDAGNLESRNLKDIWCDLLFEAEVDGEILTQEIDLKQYAGIVDLNQTSVEGNYSYGFAQTETGGKTLLKVVYTDAPVTYFTISAATTDDGTAAVVINGDLAGAALENSAETAIRIGVTSSAIDWAENYWYSEVDESGAWSITMPLMAETVGLNSNAYLHFAIVSADNHDDVIHDYGDLLSEWCENTDLDTANSMGEVVGGAIICEDASNIFYVGKSDWTGMKMFGVAK